jgi:hypothetical protein
MAVYKLNSAGIKALADKLRRRIVAVRNMTAEEAYAYWVKFGYHAKIESGPFCKNGPGWSFYYAANWNKAVGAPDESVISPERNEDMPIASYKSSLERKITAPPLKDADNIRHNVFVTNSVWYGRWLNDGGTAVGTFIRRSQPNRFIELCEEHLQNHSGDIIKKVITEVR